MQTNREVIEFTPGVQGLPCHRECKACLATGSARPALSPGVQGLPCHRECKACLVTGSARPALPLDALARQALHSRITSNRTLSNLLPLSPYRQSKLLDVRFMIAFYKLILFIFN